MDNRYYPGVEVDTAQLMNELRGLFDSDFQVQVMQVAKRLLRLPIWVQKSFSQR